MREDLIPAVEMPRRYGNSESFWAKARVYGTGPAYLKIGRRVYYSPSAVSAWLEKQSRTSTSDSGAQPEAA